MMKRLLTTIGILIIPVIWLVASRLVGAYIIPTPWVTLYDTILLLGIAQTWYTILVTFGRILLGFAIAMILGSVVGVATARRGFEYLLRPVILLMQGVPPILWSIPLILIMGFSELTPVVVIALICFPLVTTNVSEGMRTVPKELREMLDVYAPGLFPRLRELVFPHLKPFLAASVRLGLGLGIKASVVAEYFAANNGIGFEIQTAYQAFLVRKLFSWALILIGVILSADLATRHVHRLPLPKLLRLSVKRTPAPSISTIENRIASLEDTTGDVALTDVTFGYGGERPIIAGVSLVVAPGETVVLVGDSGKGKTTLLRIAAGMITPDSGTAQFPSHLGFMFQDDRFLPWLSALDNTALALHYRGYPRSQAREFARYLLQQVGLSGSESAVPAELSGGMKKRLAFARSFACIPGALFLDEPFTGLHHEARAELWSQFGALIRLRRLPVIVVTHFPEEVPAGDHTQFWRLEGEPAALIQVR
jgi:ABC-type nitrate/sulfonate/bicarbonate transport system ATPase subunit/ABC-type nitrate/sulfonate/bicarbonate transport system permease component